MITIPWQLAGIFVGGAFAVIGMLIVQIGAKADRSTQERNEDVRATRQAMSEGIRQGHVIYMGMSKSQKLEQEKDT